MPETAQAQRWQVRLEPHIGSPEFLYTLSLGRIENTSWRPIYFMGEAELRQLAHEVNTFLVERGNAVDNT